MLLALALWVGQGLEFDPARARGNYEALVSGRITLGNLSPNERAEVVALEQEVRRRATARVSDDRCRERAEASAGALTPLARAAIDLRCGADARR